MSCKNANYKWFLVETLDVGMHGAILAGLYGLDTPPKFNCRSNCTWNGSFVSLGFESSCQNVTIATIETKTCANLTIGRVREENCFMTTPGGVKFNTSMSYTVFQSSLVVSTLNLFDVSRDNFLNRRINDTAPGFARIAVWSGAEVYNSGINGAGRSPIVGEQVYQCDIRLAPWKYSNVSSTGANFTFKKELLPQGLWQWQPGGKSLVLRQGNQPDLEIKITDLDSLARFFATEPFAGNVTIGSVEGVPTGVRASFLKRNVTAIFKRVTTSMTDYVRTTANALPAIGSTAENIAFIKVQWVWFSLPLVVELLSIVVLFVTMCMNGRSMDLWKSSPMALLFTTYNPTNSEISLQIPDPDQTKGLKAKLSW
jgi:hypothetical protein